MDVLFNLYPIIPAMIYVVLAVTYHKRDRTQREQVRQLREKVGEMESTIVELCTERDMANEWALSLTTLVEESDSLITAHDIEIAAAQTKEWLRTIKTSDTLTSSQE